MIDPGLRKPNITEGVVLEPLDWVVPFKGGHSLEQDEGGHSAEGMHQGDNSFDPPHPTGVDDHHGSDPL